VLHEVSQKVLTHYKIFPLYTSPYTVALFMLAKEGTYSFSITMQKKDT